MILITTLCCKALRYWRICCCFEPLSISGALETYGEGPTLRRVIEGITVTGGHTLIHWQVVKVASNHIEVSVHQDVVGDKREICWHYGGLLTEYCLECHGREGAWVDWGRVDDIDDGRIIDRNEENEKELSIARGYSVTAPDRWLREPVDRLGSDKEDWSVLWTALFSCALRLMPWVLKHTCTLRSL